MYPNWDFWFKNKQSGNPGMYSQLSASNKFCVSVFLLSEAQPQNALINPPTQKAEMNYS
jgi:hypothetical protein